MKLLFFLSLMTSTIGWVQEPLTAPQLERILTNGTRKQWRESGKEYVMDNNACLGSGLIYVFSKLNAKNLLTIQTCTNGQWTPARHTWKIAVVEGETVLAVDESTPMAKNYPIRVVSKNPKQNLQDGNQQLQLTIQGTSKAQPTQYLLFE